MNSFQDKAFQINGLAATSMSQWVESAKIELGDKKLIESLSRIENGIRVEPYYDETTSSKMAHPLPASNDPYLGKRKWYNRPLIIVTQAKEANEAALFNLLNGADGIVFEINSPIDFSVLLQSIELEHCSVSFIVDPTNFSFAHNFHTY